MNLNKYTEKAQESILTAQQSAEQSGHPEITPEHLLVALLHQRDGIVPAVLGKMNVNVPQISSDALALLDRLPRARGGATPSPSNRFRNVTTAAEQLAERLKDEFTSTEPVNCVTWAPWPDPCPSVLKYTTQLDIRAIDCVVADTMTPPHSWLAVLPANVLLITWVSPQKTAPPFSAEFPLNTQLAIVRPPQTPPPFVPAWLP